LSGWLRLGAAQGTRIDMADLINRSGGRSLREVIVEARNLDDALKKAAEQLGVPGGQVVYQILAKTSFLWDRNTKIKASVKPVVRSLHDTIVSETDRIEYDLLNESTETTYSLNVSPDRMHVWLEVTPGYETQLRLLDQPPQRDLTLQVEISRRITNNLSVPKLYGDLMKLGISFERVIQEEIAQACSVLEPSQFLIATGVESTPGTNGTFLFLKNESGEEKRETDLSSRIDWKFRDEQVERCVFHCHHVEIGTTDG
jgi:hypothetical protein